MISRHPVVIVAALGMVLILTACGTPGAPQPPSLALPRPVGDLTATRSGNKVLLSWTPPRQTTDRENIKSAGPTLICRGVNDFPMINCPEQIDSQPTQLVRWKETGLVPKVIVTDVLKEDLIRKYPTGFASYALRDQNSHGRDAGLSNQVRVPLAPALAPPGDLKAKVTADGILLDWSPVQPGPGIPGIQYFYRIFRWAEPGKGRNLEVIVGEAPLGGESGSYVDHSAEWEQRYTYKVNVVTTVSSPGQPAVEVQGDESPPVSVLVRDIFPPAVPSGLQAVFSGVGQRPFVDLTWAPDLESDLAGYNVYRHEAGGGPVKMNSELVKAPAYRDRDVLAGHTYVYSVSAVDVRGNESEKSEEASEAVPQT
ncbi:MAG TPA: fibronectin type III domain-containing protein [Terriglobales bacterium]|nr:fibronectin type III domain-containing protein [Terriglobales bacterium]